MKDSLNYAMSGRKTRRNVSLVPTSEGSERTQEVMTSVEPDMTLTRGCTTGKPENGVYVLHFNGKPLMPTTPCHARKLLRAKKVKVVRIRPFTVQWLYSAKDYVQEVKLGIDPGNTVGVSAVRTSPNKEATVLLKAEIRLRDDVKKNLDTRRMYRRGRRSRKLRFREARFNNRKRCEGWIPPSQHVKIQEIVKLVKLCYSILPVKETVVEIAQFDVQAIKDPNIKGKEYQEGRLKAWDSLKEYVRHRDNFECQYKQYRPDIPCSGQLEVDHKQPKSRGGVDNADNLLTACHNHNLVKSNQTFEEFTGKKDKVVTFKETVFMNLLNNYLLPELKALGKEVHHTFGYRTRGIRKSLNLGKTHANDAIAIAVDDFNYKVEDDVNLIHGRFIRLKNRQLHKAVPNKKGIRANAHTNPYLIRKDGRKIQKYDLVRYKNTIGWVNTLRTTGTIRLSTWAGRELTNCSKNKVEMLQYCNGIELS